MKKIIYALRFMTVIPIPWKEGEDMAEVARSISFFPLVGLIIGLTNFGIFFLAGLLFSPLLSAVLVTVWWIFITGGLHLDGLADTADGVWGGTTKERRLEIMKDSRIGAFGVLTLISFILLKTATLNELFGFYDDNKYRALIIAPVVGRWVSVFSIFYFDSAREDGLGVFFKKHIYLKELIVALILTLLIVLPIGGIAGAAALASATVLTLVFSAFLTGKLGGLTGDTYGAMTEGTELLTLLVMLPL
ncbi:adenosylcobinamide-GDP ribazoletransferase [Spirochaeta isovalerica]|uniref:Adenosylcobinamide-GDP ribazoletransferase n=1 Tax=Spirochaeta isovalerica TaxID=150 RepID=A0A841R7X3_9SPIO|nr:adenosylcobinamide-GDP ribazoletransferase [Spirochaeta isovalerica]MBB6479069.1 adenosylcobinamide-GDP ribazoletransferase [Spirochaeta isovalerica]